MKHVLLFAYLSACFALVHAQTPDTTYLNKWGVACEKHDAASFRISQPENNMYSVNAFDMEGHKLSFGYASSLNPFKKQGRFLFFHVDGFVESVGHYVNDTLQGADTTFYPSGKVKLVVYYKNGELDGPTEGYFENGSLRRKDNFLEGELLDGKCFSSTGSDTTYYKILQMPQFVGGERALAKFLQKKISYPSDALQRGKQGKVYISFFVDQEGNVIDVYLFRGTYPSLDKEALRVVTEMPRWIPGAKEGKPAKIQFNLPIEYKLN